MTPAAGWVALTACILTVLTLGLGARSTSKTLVSTHIKGGLVSGQRSRLASTTTGSTDITSPVGSTPSPGHVTDGGNEAKLKVSKRKIGRRKNSRPKQARMLDLSGFEDTCLRWSPKLNVTINPQGGLIVVNYCLSDKLPVPTTQTCVTKPGFALCTIVEQPQCQHDFENLAAGNFTVHIKALCKTCFNVVIYNKQCVTPVFIKSVLLGNITDEQEPTTLQMKDNIPRTSDDPAIAVVAASAGTILVVVVLMLTASIIQKRHRCKRPSATTTRVSQPSPDPSNIELSTRAWRGTSHTQNMQQVRNEALLGRCQRQAQVTAEQQPLSRNTEHSGCSNTDQLQPCSSQLIRDSDDDNHSRNNVDTQTHQHESQGCEETLEDYFNIYTGLQLKSSGLRALQLPTFEIPYHLIHNREINVP